MIVQPASQSELHLLCVSAIVRDLITQHSSSSSTPPNIGTVRQKYAKKYNLEGVPRLTDVLAAVPEEWKERLRGWLRAKPVRTASGVAVVAVMCKPHRCPHVAMTGNICVYCPGGPDSDFEYSTQSYTGYEVRYRPGFVTDPSPPQCERFELGMTRTSKHGTEWTNCEVWAIPLTRSR